MHVEYNRIAGELTNLECDFWRNTGEMLMEGCISEREYRAGLLRMAVECYRLGLLSAVSIIEGRTQKS